MKKFIYAITAIMALAAFQSCQEMDPNGTVNSSKEYGFNINVNGGKGFSDAATKSVKSGWENGDRIFLFFSGQSNYVTMTYSGGSWTASPETISGIGASGQLAAVYAPYFSGDPSHSGGSWTIASGDVYYCEDKAYYTVENNKVTAVLDMVIPSDYVQFYITGVSATDVLTCNNVECWKDITINGSSLAVSSKTNAGTTMTGSKFSTNDNGIVFYGRLKSGDLPTDCELTVTNSGKTYQRTIAGKHLTGRTAYTLGTFSTSSWSLKESRPDGALTGKFSISATTQVYFSKGNLKYVDGTTKGTWSFETNQYEFSTYPGDHNTPSNTYGLFGWGDAPTLGPVNTSTNNSDYSWPPVGQPDPWGSKIDGEGTWRVLSSTEWNYLNNTRRINGTYPFALATVNDIHGYVILPDDWVLPDGCSYVPGYSSESWSQNSYSAESWEKMESAGAVFLPTTGYRSGETLEMYGTRGNYWTSTKSSSSGQAMALYRDDFSIYDRDMKMGNAVRLVTVVPTE